MDQNNIEISSGYSFVQANDSNNNISMTAEDLGIKENGSYTVIIGVKEYSEKYGHLLYNPELVTTIRRVTVTSFTN